MLAIALVLFLAPQQLLDRVLANVDGSVITLTDLNAAIALGVVDVPQEGDRGSIGLQRLIERRLVLAEVARFAPPDPTTDAVDKEVAAMTARAGGSLTNVMNATGIDEARVREIARDTLRIQSYGIRRFGPAGMNSPEVAQWLRDLRTRATVTVRP